MEHQLHGPDHSNKKVLVVDDEANLTSYIKLKLEKTGRFDVVTENDPYKVVDLARQFKPDVILLDILMPGRNGQEIAERIHKDPEFRGIRIIFFSSLLTIKETGKSGKIIGGHMCLAKPARGNCVIDCIDKSMAEPAFLH